MKKIKGTDFTLEELLAHKITEEDKEEIEKEIKALVKNNPRPLSVEKYKIYKDFVNTNDINEFQRKMSMYNSRWNRFRRAVSPIIQCFCRSTLNPKFQRKS